MPGYSQWQSQWLHQGRVSSINLLPNSTRGSSIKGFLYWISQGPSLDKLPPVPFVNKVPMKTGLLLTKTKTKGLAWL